MSWIASKKLGRLKTGDFVFRKNKSEGGDYFKCHPFSFGQIVNIVEENKFTRPDSPFAEQDEPWHELLVLPFDKRMAPAAEDGWIQWGPSEVIKVPRLIFCLLGLMWPLLRWLYPWKLDGRTTDYFCRKDK